MSSFFIHSPPSQHCVCDTSSRTHVQVAELKPAYAPGINTPRSPFFGERGDAMFFCVFLPRIEHGEKILNN